MDELVAWYRQQLDEDARAAKEAIDPERPGTHWQWIDPSDDTPAEPDQDGYLRGASLRTVEHFPTRLSEEYGQGNDLPAFAIYTAEEMRAGVGDHIARHDPAAVLADVAAKRAILDSTVGEIERYGNMPPEAHIMADEVVKALASAYRHRPGWKAEWEA